jgi:anti-anti-sigma factor
VKDDTFGVEMLDGSRGARLRGELDLSTYEDAARELAALFDGSGDVMLDVGEVSFVDSSGIRLFIRLHQSTQDGVLVLRSPQPHVERLLRIAGLPDLGVRMDGGSG